MKCCYTNMRLNKQSRATWKMLILTFILMNFLLVFKVSAQGSAITGVIVDEKNQPLTGVNVVVKGKTTGTISDIDGKYSIIAASTDILSFTFVGFKTEEIPVGTQTQINVTLKEEVTALNEVVVIGYGVQKRSDLTGAVSSVSSEKLQNMPVLGIDQALQGKIAGVDISSNSGAPGSDMTIRIRGTGTINNADPIVVVDGMIFGQDILKTINSSDIESISVLKDASATAIYGSRGANGVIMITTKKGTSGPTVVSFNMYIGNQEAAHYLTPMSGPDFARLMNKINKTTYWNPDTVANTNWLKAVSQVAPIQNYEFSLRGGNEKSTFLFSSSYLNQDGILINTFYRRLITRLDLDHKVKDWLSIGEDLQVSYAQHRTDYEGDPYNRPLPLGGNGAFNPITPIYNKDGSYARSVLDSAGNPVAHRFLNNPLNTDSRVIGDVYGEISCLKDFKFKSSLNIDYGFYEYSKFNPIYQFNKVDQNPLSNLEGDYSKSFGWQFINTLNWHKVLGVHEINIMVGTEASESNSYYVNSNAQDVLPNQDPSLQYFNYFNSFPSSIYKVTGGADHGSMFSLLGRLNYSWNDQLLFTGTFRRDGSSKFLANYVYGDFPSFALAYKLSNLSFIKNNVPQISSLKIRLGWGQIGNSSSTNATTVYPIINKGMTYAIDGQPVTGMTTLAPPNTDLRWETTTERSIGLDATLFKNKLEFTADYFNKKTTDMICQVPQPGDVGIPASVQPFQNIGAVTNKGFELSINYRSTIGKFNYSVGGFVSHIANNVDALATQGSIISGGNYGSWGPISRTAVGYPIASFYGYKVDGIFQSWQQVKSHAVASSKTAPGDLIYEDINGDGKIDSHDQTYIGSPFPKMTYGFNIEAGFMNFDLRAQFQGVYKVDILTPYKWFTYDNSGNIHNEVQADLLNAWTPQNTNTNVPRIDPSKSNQNQDFVSSWFIEDGSYLRLKNFQLGYNLPKSWLDKIKIQKLRVYIGGQNLLTFTKYKGNDPEVGLSQPNNSGNPNLGSRDPKVINVDFISVPQARTIMFGVNLSF
jgi:TonB-dependent starch-binding outer membrane protein SusC